MTERERICSALGRGIPDLVPIREMTYNHALWFQIKLNLCQKRGF